MNYIIERIKTINIKVHLSILIISSTIISITGVIFTKNFYDYNSDTNIFISYVEIINSLWIYYIPIVSLYLYLSSTIIDYNVEKRYIYKFKSKKLLVKSNIIITLIYTISFCLINNLILLMILLFNFNPKIDIKTILNLILSIALQIFVLFIYNLICLLVDLIFYKQSNLAILVTKVFLLLSVLFSVNSSYYNIINNISLYKFFTLSNIIKSKNTILYSILLLSFISYSLILLIISINNEFEYLRIPFINEEA